MRNHTLLLGTKGIVVERGLLPMLNYRERERKGNLSVLKIESAQLRGVPWVFDVHPYFRVA
jgi:hypothetical protein